MGQIKEIDPYLHTTFVLDPKEALARKQMQIKIANIAAANQLEKFRVDAELRANKLDQYEKEQFITQLKFIILTVSLLLLVILVYWVVQQNKKRVERLQLKNKEISSQLNFKKNKAEKMALKISVGQEYISVFIEKLKSLLTKVKEKELKNEIVLLLHELESYSRLHTAQTPSLEKEPQLEEDYMFKLHHSYPALSEDERYLCSLIHLKFKNKEIANLLNLSVRSVENRRYRIRKKMNLKTEERLGVVLSAL